jgi:Ser/Thr protein kinase RdoA (MazF antagonist)
MGLAVQDLWMLLSGNRRQRTHQLGALLDGYEPLRPFDRCELTLIELRRHRAPDLQQLLPMRKGLAVGKPPQAAARVAQKCIKP